MDQLRLPMSRKKERELRKEYAIYNPYRFGTQRMINQIQTKTLVRREQQKEGEGPVECFYDLVQKSTGRVITRRAMLDSDALRKNKAITSSFWRRVGY